MLPYFPEYGQPCNMNWFIEPARDRFRSDMSPGMVSWYAAPYTAPDSLEMIRLPARFAGPENCLYPSTLLKNANDSHSGALAYGMFASISIGRLYTTCAENCCPRVCCAQLLSVRR